MKKILLLAMLMTSLCVGRLSAQDYDYYDFSDCKWTDFDGTQYAPAGTFWKVSANGRFAVGYDDVIYSGSVYYWDAEDAEDIKHLNRGYNRVALCDVSNDGVMVGSNEERESIDSDEPTVSYPAYYQIGKGWTNLPVPNDYSTLYATKQDFMDQARAITPDGKFIAGNVHLTRGYKETIFGDKTEAADIVPVLWTRNDMGEYELTNVYEGLGKNSLVYKDGELVPGADTVNYQVFFVWDISNDGKTIVGVNTAGCGGQNPAFIRDGKLVQIFDCGEEDAADEVKNFNGGICNSVDANGNIYGYYEMSEAYTFKYFMFTKDNELVFLDDQWVICADKDGNKYGQAFQGLYMPLDCSEDGAVVAGNGMLNIQDLGVVNVPALVWNKKKATAIERPSAAQTEVRVDYRRGGELFVNGIYQEATIYDAAGKMIAQGKQGKSFNLSNQPNGIYLVKVTTAKGAKTFKVTR